MSWQDKGTNYEAILKGVWQDVPSVTAAPAYDSPEFILEEELHKDYKSINEKGIWIVRNPALIKMQIDNRARVVYRRTSQFAMTLADAKKESNKFRFNSNIGISENEEGINL